MISAGSSYLTLIAFGSNVCDIAQREDVTAESLLSASPFQMTYENNVITSIHRTLDSQLSFSYAVEQLKDVHLVEQLHHHLAH